MSTVNTVPVFTSAVLLARTALTSGNTLRTILDLTGKYGADLWVLIGRQSTTAYGSNPPSVIIRPTYSTDTKRVPGDVYGRPCNSTTAVAPTLSSGITGGSSTALALSAGTSFAADQIIAIETGTSSVEFGRVSKVVSNTVTLDAPVAASHSSGVTVTNYAESMYFSLPGGRQYEIIVDYGNSSSGPDLDVVKLVNTYDKDAST